MKLKVNLFNIISSLIQLPIAIFALLFQYISNVDITFYFLTIFFSFADCCLEVHSSKPLSIFKVQSTCVQSDYIFVLSKYY